MRSTRIVFSVLAVSLVTLIISAYTLSAPIAIDFPRFFASGAPFGNESKSGKPLRDELMLPELVVQNGHPEPVTCISSSNLTGIIASCSAPVTGPTTDSRGDNCIRLWSREGKLLKTLLGHNSPVTQVKWSPDGKLLASSAEGEIILWDHNGTMIIKSDKYRAFIRGIEWSPDGTMFATYGPDICIWDQKGSLIKVFGIQDGWMECVAWSPDSKTLASSSSINAIRLWDTTGRILNTLPGHEGTIYKIAFSPDGITLASCSGDKTVRLWSIDGKPLKILTGHTSAVSNLAWHPGGKAIASCSEDTTIRLWDTDGKCINVLKSHGGWVYNVLFSPDGERIASSAQNEIKLWDKSGQCIAAFEGHSKWINMLIFSPDGKTITSCSDDKSIRIWNLQGKSIHITEGFSSRFDRIIYSPDGKVFSLCLTRCAGIYQSYAHTLISLFNSDNLLLKGLNEHTDCISAIAFSPDSIFLASSSYDGSVILWDRMGKSVKTMKTESVAALNCAFSPDSKTIAACYSDNKIRLWSITGELVSTLNGHTDMPRELVFHNNGKVFASSSANEIIVWDVKGKLLYTSVSYEMHYNQKFRFRPFDNGMVSCGMYGLRVLDGTGKLVTEITDHNANNVLYSPDGKVIISSSNSEIHLRDYDGKLVRVLTGHTGYIYTMVFSPESSIFATCSDDATIRLWDRDGGCIGTLKGHTGRIYDIAFSKNGKELVSCSDDTSVMLWDVASGNSIARLYAFNNGTGLAFTPDYYYRLSGDAVNAVAFVKRMKAYGFDQFDLRHNRPDILLERLYPGKDRPTVIQSQIDRFRKYWQYRVRQNGFTEPQVSGTTKIHAPEVFDVSLNGLPMSVLMEERKRGIREADRTFNEREVKLSFKLRDEAGSDLAIIGYKIFVNGVPVHGQYIKRFPKPSRVQSVEETIALSSTPDVGGNPGDNKIEISGFTEDGIESNRETVSITYTGADKRKKGNLYIVSLGINDYSKAKGFESLEYAVGDSKDIAKTFSEAGKVKYDTVITLQYLNDEVKRDAIMKIKSGLAKTTVDDTVVFFMAGHGVRADTPVSEANTLAMSFGINHEIGDIGTSRNNVNLYYYMTGDSNPDKPWVSAIPMDAIRHALDGIPARQKILLIDTCQSGENPLLSGYTPSMEKLEEIRKSRGAQRGSERGIKLVRKGTQDARGIQITAAWALDQKEMSDMFPELRRGTGTIEISAATGVQSALESAEWKNGAFTFVVKEAILQGKAKDKDGRITAKSLRRYVLGRVEEITNGDQTPMVCRDIAGRDFDVIGK